MDQLCALIIAGLSLTWLLPSTPTVSERLTARAAGQPLAVAAPISPREWTQFQRDVERDAPVWVHDAPAEQRSRRRAVLGVFILELAHESMTLHWPEAKRLVEWMCQFYRTQGASSDDELRWHLSALALIEGAGDSFYLVWTPEPYVRVQSAIGTMYDHLNHFASRFPADQHAALARATAHERETYPALPRGAPWDADESAMKRAYDDVQFAKEYSLQMAPLSDDKRRAAKEYERRLKISRVADEFEALSRWPDVADEALVRAAILRLRIRQYERALQLLGRAHIATDPFLSYVVHWHLGEMHEELSQSNEAIADYGAALAIEPRGQTAGLALAAVLVRTGRVSEARALATSTLDGGESPIDPMKTYGYGEWRLWSERMAVLRRAAGLTR